MKLPLGALSRRLARPGAALALFLILPLHDAARADTQAADGDIAVTLDQARLVSIPERTATVIVGNPLIADVSVQPGGLMVLTGKGYGTTNLIALDREGNRLMEKTLLVQAPARTVVVYRGVLRETWSCAPVCEPRNTPGDAPAFFNITLNQTVTRNNQAGAIK